MIGYLSFLNCLRVTSLHLLRGKWVECKARDGVDKAHRKSSSIVSYHSLAFLCVCFSLPGTPSLFLQSGCVYSSFKSSLLGHLV